MDSEYNNIIELNRLEGDAEKALGYIAVSAI
jgi:hypothetical protein